LREESYKGPVSKAGPYFVSISAVTGRILGFVFAMFLVRGDALDDAVGQWGKKIASHLAADEIAHVTWNGAAVETAEASAYAARAKTLLGRALQRRLRNPKSVEVTATLSQNLKGYLFIAEMHRENENVVEIVSAPRPILTPETAAAFRLERRLLWEQETPILDVIVVGDQMLVLDTAGIARYEQHDSKWQRAEAEALDIPPVRDPRGRLTVTENSLIAEVPGLTCRGAWRPAIAIECQPGGRFTAGRNTIEEAGWQPYFTHAEVGGDHVVAAADGHSYVYDATRKQMSVSDVWSDFAVVASSCAGAKIIAAYSATHSVAIFDLLNHSPVRVSDSMEVPGPVTAIWPAGGTALTVVRNKDTNRYEAYSIAVDCGR
jgi:hypothetical protein